MRNRRRARKLPARVSALIEAARVFKAGNSLAIRIPSVVAKRLDLEDGSEVEMGLEEDALWISPAAPRRPNLSELLDKITPENIHAEVDWGPAVGREILDD